MVVQWFNRTFVVLKQTHPPLVNVFLTVEHQTRVERLNIYILLF